MYKLPVFSLLFFSFLSLYQNDTQELNLQWGITFLEEECTLMDTLSFQEMKISIENLRFYISNIALFQTGQKKWQEENSYHLIDFSDTFSIIRKINIPASLTYDSITFQLGIDSLTNVSGAMGGDLDPSKGMYWTWQSGYINFKLEGYASLCPSRKNKFQFHLGGYAAPFESIQSLGFPMNGNEMKISIDIGRLLKQINLQKQYKLMSPGAETQTLSKLAASVFYVEE